MSFTYKELLDITTGKLIFQEVTPINYLWDDIIKETQDLSKSAVEKFGVDPQKFKDLLGGFNDRVFMSIREGLEKYPGCYSTDPSSISSFGVQYMQAIINAILQVNMEVPGFKDNFPEITVYLRKIHSHDSYYLKRDIDKKVGNYYAGYNRFSGKHDMKTIKNLLRIQEKDLEEKKYHGKERIDDYIARHLPELLGRTKSRRLQEYMKANFTFHDDLLPEDYFNIVFILSDKKRAKELDELKKTYESSAVFWIEYYFKNQKELLEDIKYEDLSVEIVRKINSTRI